jgi:hypothetical protein
MARQRKLYTIDQRTGLRVDGRRLVQDGHRRGVWTSRENADPPHPQSYLRMPGKDGPDWRPGEDLSIGTSEVVSFNGRVPPGATTGWQYTQALPRVLTLNPYLQLSFNVSTNDNIAPPDPLVIAYGPPAEAINIVDDVEVPVPLLLGGYGYTVSASVAQAADVASPLLIALGDLVFVANVAWNTGSFALTAALGEIAASAGAVYAVGSPSTLVAALGSTTLAVGASTSATQSPLVTALGATAVTSSVAYGCLQDALTATVGSVAQRAVVSYSLSSPDPLVVALGTVNAGIGFTIDAPNFTVMVAIGSVGMVASTAYGVTAPSALVTAQGAANPSAANTLTIDPDRQTYWSANGGDAALYTGWGGGTWGGVDAGVAQATVQVGNVQVN